MKIFRKIFGKYNEIRKEAAENLNRLDNDTYNEALKRLKKDKETSENKEAIATIEINKAINKNRQVLSIKSKVKQGHALNDLEALSVGLLRL